MQTKSIFRAFSICVICIISPFQLYAGGTSSNYKECNFEDNMHLLEINLDLLDKKNEKMLQGTTEGAQIYKYYDNDKLLAIKSTFYGETSKSEYNYYFANHEMNRFLVVMTDYHYSAPIFQPELKIASVSTQKLFICEGEDKNYPDYYKLKEYYERSIDTLKLIIKL